MNENSCEKLVKYTIKLIAKVQELDYLELKSDAKKVLKTAKKYDEYILSIMNEIMDIGNVGSEEELDDFDIDVLKMYCRVKELDTDLSEKKTKALVWKHIQEEFEFEDSDDSDSDESDQETEQEIEVEVEPEVSDKVLKKALKKTLKKSKSDENGLD